MAVKKPLLKDIDGLMAKARKQAKEAGMKRADIAKAIAKAIAKVQSTV
ncbi:MAG: hypothetical protein KC643_22380 [Nitrospira sp.]|nr:hypothetical protein [Nitrospira sp.]MCA9468169.1 hypothetical protein [Nitrospira sp.]